MILLGKTTVRLIRAYGPALQATGEKAYGYDVFTKRVPEPVVEDRYDGELNRNIYFIT